jgi:hypothetical protein
MGTSVTRTRLTSDASSTASASAAKSPFAPTYPAPALVNCSTTGPGYFMNSSGFVTVTKPVCGRGGEGRASVRFVDANRAFDAFKFVRAAATTTTTTTTTTSSGGTHEEDAGSAHLVRSRRRGEGRGVVSSEAFRNSEKDTTAHK